MNSYKILHCADLHLGSPLRGLEADPDAPAALIRDAARQALTNLVDFAIAEQVSVVLIAGDLFDGQWQHVPTSRFLTAELTRLAMAGIHTVAVSGNHDAESTISSPARWPIQARMLRADKAETVSFDELGLHIHGRSFPARAVPDSFLPNFPDRKPGAMNIGLLHSSATGSDSHASYAPCTVEEMKALGYEYWALGHIHKRTEISRDPWIVFPGNLQGRHSGETGEKGATLIHVTAGAITDVAHHTLDVVRWARIKADITGATDQDAALTIIRHDIADALQAASPRLLAARLLVHGQTEAHADLLRDSAATREKIRGEAAAAGGAGRLWLEKIDIETEPQTARTPATELEHLLLREIQAPPAETITAPMQKWAAGLLDKYGPLRAEIANETGMIQLANGVIAPELMHAARALLDARLRGSS
jgi:exonuclease SbcD